VAAGQILGFSIDLLRRPYNTRTTVRVCDSGWRLSAITSFRNLVFMSRDLCHHAILLPCAKFY